MAISDYDKRIIFSHFGDRQDPEIAWSIILWCDRADNAFERSHPGRSDTDESVMIEGLLNGHGDFIRHREPSARNGIGDLVQRCPDLW